MFVLNQNIFAFNHCLIPSGFILHAKIYLYSKKNSPNETLLCNFFR